MTTKEQGIKKVIDNNESDHAAILGFAREWVKSKMRPFTADDLRIAYEEVYTPPKQPKIYGGVFNTLVREKRIIQNGSCTSKRPEAHSRLIRVWISAEYSKQQSENRKKEDNQINLFET